MSKRRYRQVCGVARALDLVGERWTLLIVRNLLVGPSRFSELSEDLPGIAPNLLSKRLNEMQAAGLIERVRFRSPSRAQGHALTAVGRALEPVVLALGRWGSEHVPLDRDDEKNLRWALLSLKRRHREGRRTQLTQLLSERRAFHLETGGAELLVGSGEVPRSDLQVSGPEATLLRWLIGGESCLALVEAGELELEGSRRSLRSFARSLELVA